MIHNLLFQWILPGCGVVVGFTIFVSIFIGLIELGTNLIDNCSETWDRVRAILFWTVVPTAVILTGHMMYVIFTRPGGF